MPSKLQLHQQNHATTLFQTEEMALTTLRSSSFLLLGACHDFVSSKKRLLYYLEKLKLPAVGAIDSVGTVSLLGRQRHQVVQLIEGQRDWLKR